MNPAYSVILFTTASGAGYGLLALLGLVGFQHGPASSFGFALVSITVGLVLVTIGLLSSTLHLGHPERAWRAFSQWRSSWLSREGIAAVLAYPIVIAFGLVWSGGVDAPRLVGPLGLATACIAFVTVFCTGKIYSTLTTIRQWHSSFTVPVYLLFAVASGAAVLGAIAVPFGRFQVFQALLSCIALAITAIAKVLYWSSIDRNAGTYTMAAATGLGEGVRQWEVPHTTVNFIQKEMGFVVARHHARLLRLIVLLALFVASVLALFAQVVSPWLMWPCAALALFAAVIERWLFFAEAEHVSMLFYGKERA